MSPWHSVRSRSALMMLVVLICGQARAADTPAKPSGSLALVPADASLYVSSLRLREQLDIARRSKAWRRFTEIPAVQMGWQVAQPQLNDPNGPLATMRRFFEVPDNKQLLQLLGDMVSSEVFVYGDASLAQFATVFLEAYGSVQASNLVEVIRDATNPASAADRETRVERQAERSREVTRAFLTELAAHVDDLTIPNVVIGFQLSDTEPAQAQLKRLEMIARLLVQNPQLPERLKHVQIDDIDYLTLALDGGLVPWQEIPWQRLEDQPEEFAPLVAKLKTLTMNVTLGVRGKYLLLSIGSSNEHLARLGKGDLLVDRPELKPLARFAGARLAGVGFYDSRLRTAVGTSKKDFDQISDAAAELIAELKLSKPLAERVTTDLRRLIADVKRFVPDIGAMLGFSLLTDRGIEAYTYDWSENLLLDGSKPLSLLDHLGGRPLAALVVRGKYDPQQWDLLAKWVGIGYGYLREFALPEMEPDDRARFDQIVEIALPLIERFGAATRDLLIPALADSQSALVLEAQLTSRQWQNQMPKSNTPLPILEPALVLGVSDAQLLKRGLSEYLAIANRAVEEIRKVNPKAIPADFKLPPPEKTDTKSGANYSYTLPAEAGLDPRLAPNAGLSRDVVVFSLAPEQTQALLENRPLTLPAALGDAKQPLAAAAWFDWAGLIDAVLPWIDYGQQVADSPAGNRGGAPGGGLDPQTLFVLDSVRASLKVLKFWHTYASVTYVDGKALVVHSEMHLEDLD